MTDPNSPDAPEGSIAEQQACEAPRDCKHGQLRRTCQLCELESEEHILRHGGVIEVAVRNANVAEWMRHWEGRATKAERDRDGFKGQLAAEREHGRLLQTRLDEARALNNAPPSEMAAPASDLVQQLEGALINSEGKDFNIRADFVREVIAALSESQATIEACHALIDKEDRGPSRAVSTDGGKTWTPHTLQYRTEILLRVNKEACAAIEQAEEAQARLAAAERERDEALTLWRDMTAERKRENERADTAEREREEAVQKLACKCVCEFTGSGNERKINKTCEFHTRQLSAAKDEAVRMEREACAAIADSMGDSWAANAIRARSEGGK